MDRLDQTVCGNPFQQITAGAMLQSAENVFIVIKGRQDDDLYLRIVFLDDLGALHAVHLRHSDIHQNNIRFVFPDSPDHLDTVRRSIYRKIRIARQHDAQAVPYQFLIVRNKYFNHFPSPTLSGFPPPRKIRHFRQPLSSRRASPAVLSCA